MAGAWKFNTILNTGDLEHPEQAGSSGVSATDKTIRVAIPSLRATHPFHSQGLGHGNGVDSRKPNTDIQLPWTANLPYHNVTEIDPSISNSSPPTRLGARVMSYRSPSPVTPNGQRYSDSIGGRSSYNTSATSSASRSHISSLSAATESHYPPMVTGDRQAMAHGPWPANRRIQDFRPTAPAFFTPKFTNGANIVQQQEEAIERGSPADKLVIQPSRDDRSLLQPSWTPPHRRTVSAPQLIGSGRIDLPTMGEAQGPGSTTPGRHDARQNREASRILISREGTTEESPEPFFDPDEIPTEIKCMFTEHCKTRSTPRKAISHLFGRNKLSTRQIPDLIWVHYCRKHYQRVRYRNMLEYSKVQMSLVMKQLDRVNAWSNENERLKRTGVVQSWSLGPRKREKQRLASAGATKKRKAVDITPDQDDDDGHDQPVWHERKKGTTLPNAIPPWLLGKCRSGYSTAELKEVMQELKNRIEMGEMECIPDIEMLPVITMDPEEEARPKNKRRNVGAHPGHMRAVSLETLPSLPAAPASGYVPSSHGPFPYTYSALPQASGTAAWAQPPQCEFTFSPVNHYGIGNPYAGAGQGYAAAPRTMERLSLNLHSTPGPWADGNFPTILYPEDAQPSYSTSASNGYPSSSSSGSFAPIQGPAAQHTASLAQRFPTYQYPSPNPRQPAYEQQQQQQHQPQQQQQQQQHQHQQQAYEQQQHQPQPQPQQQAYEQPQQPQQQQQQQEQQQHELPPYSSQKRNYTPAPVPARTHEYRPW